ADLTRRTGRTGPCERAEGPGGPPRRPAPPQVLTRAHAPSALHAHHLLELGHDLDQVPLLVDDLLDRLVRARDLVDDAGVLAALHAPRLLLQVLGGEAPLGRVAAHPAAGAVGRRVEGPGVAETLDDVRARAHGARDDPVLAGARADRALAGDEQVHAVVALLGHVVVVGADLLLEDRLGLLELLADHVLQERHHDRAVAARVLL